MAGIVLEFSHHGDFDSFGIIRSSTPTNLASLPTPLVTGLSTMFYVDTAVIEGQTYYYRPVVWRNGEMLVGNEVEAIAVEGDPLFTNVELLIFADGAPIVDSSSRARAISNSNVSINNNIAPLFDDYVAQFNGSNSRLTIDLLAVGTDDFCLEAFISPVAAMDYGRIFQYGEWSSGALILLISGGTIKYLYYNWSTGVIQLYDTGVAVSLNNWKHLAMIKKSGVLYIFYGGVKIFELATNNVVSGSVLYIGASHNESESYNGYMNSIRYTSGERYDIENFIVPSKKFLAQ